MRNHSLMVLVLLLLALTACTEKKNPVGYNSIGEPKYLEFGSEVLGNFYSYEDSINSYSSSSILTIGNFEEYEMLSLIRFYGLPDSLVELENSYLSLSMVVSHIEGEQSSTYQFGRLGQYWSQNEVTWETASDTTSWKEDFEEPFWELIINGEYSSLDTIDIQIPSEYIYSYESGKYYADSLIADYGFYIKRSDPVIDERNFIEYYSYESDASLQPSLSFGYKSDTDEESFTTWNNGTIYDASIYRSENEDLETYSVYSGVLKLRNISPVKLLLGINIGYEDFIESGENTGIYSAEDYDKMTINKAYLVLYAKEYYSSNDYIYTQPALITDSSILEIPEENEIPEYDENYTLISGVVTTQDSIMTEGENKYYKIDITSALQSYTTSHDEEDGYGLVIRSIRENRDFSFVEFYTGEENAELSPYLEIYYTPPLEP